MYGEGKVIIPNIGNKGLQDVLTLDPVISLIALFCSLNTFSRISPECCTIFQQWMEIGKVYHFNSGYITMRRH